jgi:uncharacterized glyoxalase superfamily protein PhnB
MELYWTYTSDLSAFSRKGTFVMSASASSSFHSRAGVVPVLRYRSVEAAVAWLTHAFGFEESRFVRDAEGNVRYAQLAWRDGMIMLCPIGGSAFDACMAQPTDIGGCATQVAYVQVEDVEAHKARALKAGAEIVFSIPGTDGADLGYSCRDIEGHVWSFGSYDPWRHVEPLPEAPAASSGWRASRLGILGLLVAALMAAGYVYFEPSHRWPALTFAATAATEKPADIDKTEALLRQAREDLARERDQRILAERTVQESKDAGNRERHARAEAEKSAADARKALAETSDRLVRAERAMAARSDVGASAAPVSKAPQATQAACDPEVQARVERDAARAAAAATAEIAALKAKIETVLSELAQARLKVQQVSVREDLRAELERERAGRERAERQLREVQLRSARLKEARTANEVAPPKPKNDAYAYRDLSQEIFPLPGTPR